ncbi:TPA: hypothetical protein N0F65_001575 [Lagenidium giganteum]|uniref:Uncharacterized protein n=1 Tax=Lagenidium giganteum TaxID=4803 RepID=A0AAV2Z4W1_9STRA|nr:TPA: hypothetical protein N0F65_001575 [Lagenidium giganteum]
MEVGTEVWAQCDEHVWASGVVLDCQEVRATGRVKVKLDNGDIVTRTYMDSESDGNQVFIRNTARDYVHMPCLMGMEHLHEPALLHALSERFQHDHVYTYIGDILLAMNPFKELPLYSEHQINHYKAALGQGSQAPDAARKAPHVFAIAAKAYHGLLHADAGRNQSILVSGESGSGKTETTKFLMQFLTAVGREKEHTQDAGDDHDHDQQIVEIGKRILQTNPILESFGNARTIRNDNSSRFGKFIKLQFGAQNEIIGAEISSYLLEKVRLIHQSPDERSFHIFYELLEGADSDMMEALGLSREVQYELLNHYTPSTRRNSLGRQYASRFCQTVEAFDDTGVEEEERTQIFQVLAALLHLGNVNFTSTPQSTGQGGAIEDVVGVTESSRNHLVKCAELLGVSAEELESLLLTREITAGSDVLLLRVNAEQAKDICRSVAKTIYGRLFTWIVGRLSDGINYRESLLSMTGEGEEPVKTIGILDIFGFESLDSNGFEQLCINYANERLQAQFNEFVFVKEQDLYMSEGINWTSISYPSNAPCLALFDDKANGLFSLLDQECMIPKGTNQALSTKFYRYHGGGELISDFPSTSHPDPSSPVKVNISQKYTLPLLVTSFGRYLHQNDSIRKEAKSLSANSPFSASKMDRVKHQFVVHHFAGRVCYRIEEFLEKNQDLLPMDARQLLLSSKNDTVSSLGLMNSQLERRVSDSINGARRRSSLLRGPSVSAQFKGQLDLLIDEISHTEAHYIRCLKPNEDKQADVFDRKRVVEQLRSVGVLEALRVARAGYASRLSHQAFYDRFFSLRRAAGTSSHNAEAFALQTCAWLLKELNNDGNGFRYAAMNSGVSARDFNKVAQDDGVQMGKTTVFCKREVINYFLHRRAEVREHGAVAVQKQYRALVARRSFQRLRHGIIAFQSLVRGHVTRIHVRAFRKLQLAGAARVIQRAAKQWMAHRSQLHERVRIFMLRRYFEYFNRGCVAQRQQKVKTAEQPVGAEEDSTDLQSCASLDEKYASEGAPEAAVISEEGSEEEEFKVEAPVSVRKHGKHRSRKQSMSDDEGGFSSRRKASQARKKKSVKDVPVYDHLNKRNRRLESEIVRLQQMLVDSQSSRRSHGVADRLPPRKNSRAVHSRRHYHDEYETKPTHGGRRVKTRRSMSLDELEFSEDGHESDEDNDENDASDDDDHDLPLPRRAQSVYHSQRQTKVSKLTRKIEELDAKCQFLEHLVARTGYEDPRSSLASMGYSQRSSGPGSGPWDRRNYGHERASFQTYHRPSTYMQEGPLPPPRSIDGESTGGMEGILRNLQQQMEMLRQSVAHKEEAPASYHHHHHQRHHEIGSSTSSVPTRSSTSNHSQGSHGHGGDYAYASSHQVPPSPHHSTTSMHSPTHAPPTPSFMTPRGPPRSAPAYFNSTPRAAPRIVKWARANHCFECEEAFSLFVRRHHCRMCGNSFCHEHSSRRVSIFGIGFDDEPVRVCDTCFGDFYTQAAHQDPYCGSVAPGSMASALGIGSTPRHFPSAFNGPSPPPSSSFPHTSAA